MSPAARRVAERATTARTTAGRTTPETTADVVSIVPLEPGDTRRAPLGRVLRVATRPVSIVWPRPTVDEWGRDGRLVSALAPLAHLRWNVTVGGEHLLPEGGALVVVNTRRLALTPISTALALCEALDRPVRFVGRPDVVPFGPFLRRVGGLLAHPDEIRGALRAGELVVLGAHGTTSTRQAGVVDAQLVAPAIREGVPLHLAATLSTSTSRAARVEIGPALHATNARRGPLAEVELAEQAQRRLQDMLDELGSSRSGVPGLSWLGEG